MTTYRPATPHSNAIKRPACPQCGTAMLLFGIEAERPGYELHSFDCPKCRRIETRVGKAE
jgi:predicted RNA-binding Zn-ribbon protein involved in translation (DUF1610 family)